MTTNIYKKENINSNMKRLIIVLTLFFLFAIPQLSALNTQPTVKQGECINISQTCASCSYVNISSITNREDSNLILNQPMSGIGNGEWRYEFCNTTFLGRYDVKGQGDINGVDESFATDFYVTPSGESGTENIVFFLIILVLLYTLTLLLFFRRDIELAPFVVLTGSALGTLGLYMIRNGIVVYRDYFTNYLSYVTMFLGFGLATWSLIEWIQNNI
jgi:hypothetical protein